MKKLLVTSCLAASALLQGCGSGSGSKTGIDTLAVVRAYKKKILNCRLDPKCRHRLDTTASANKISYPPDYSLPIPANSLGNFTDIHGEPLYNDPLKDSFVLFDAATLSAFIDVNQNIVDVHFTFARQAAAPYNLTLLITGSDANGRMIYHQMPVQGTGGTQDGYFENCMPCPTCNR